MNFNAGYVIDALSAIAADEVFIHAIDESTPVLLTVPGQSWHCVIAPCRLPQAEPEPSATEQKPAAPKAVGSKPRVKRAANK